MPRHMHELTQNSNHLVSTAPHHNATESSARPKSDHFSNPEPQASFTPSPRNPTTQLTRHHPPTTTMFLQRSAVAVARRAAVAPVLRRTIATTVVRRKLLVD